MVGNSLASDVVPALDAGAWGVHVPSDYNWAARCTTTAPPTPRASA